MTTFLNWKEKLFSNFEFTEPERQYVYAKADKIKDLSNTNPNEFEVEFIKFIEKILEASSNIYDWAQILNLINIDSYPSEGMITILSFLEKKIDDILKTDTWKIASYRRICFELKNAIYCRAWNNLQYENELVDQCRALGKNDLADRLKSVSSHSLTLPITGYSSDLKEDPTKIFSNASIANIPQFTNFKINTEKPRVLVASLEYLKAKFGGVGTVAIELLASMNKHGQDARIITPLYNSYVSDYYDQLTFVGVINHPFQGEWIQSTIYSTKTQNDSVIQYFVKPPKTLIKINDIGESSDIYTNTHESSIVDRTQYLTSAATAFASSYVGEDKQSPFQILHTNSWILGFAGELLTNYYNPMREKAGLNHLAHVAHVHGTGNNEQGRRVNPKIYDDLGLRRPKGLAYAHVNMQAHTYATSYCDIHPSNWSAESSKTKKYGYKLHELVVEKANMGRLFGIRNGIFREFHDPFSSKIYGTFAFKQTITDGIDKTDYISQREAVKKKLYEEGVIADPNKPLFLYVGRLETAAKGIDALPAMVKRIHSEKGQCVVMGSRTGEAKGEKVIEELQKLQKKYPNTLKVYTDYKTDQLAVLNGTQSEKGKLIRLASDFAIVPSHKESDGLVPKELLTCGAMLISSNIEGLTDTSRGLGDTLQGEKITLDNFNGFTYKNNFLFKRNGSNSIKRAIKFFNTANKEVKNKVIGRLIKDSEAFDWKEAIEKINLIYKKASVPRTADEISSMKKLEEKFYRRNFSIKVIAKTILRKLHITLKRVFDIISALFNKIKISLEKHRLDQVNGKLKAA